LQGREVAAIAVTLGISEPTARKRLTRAVERLRAFHARHGGAVTSAVGITEMLQIAGKHSAPRALVESLVSGGAVAGTAGATVAATAEAVMKTIACFKIKVAACVLGTVLGAGGAVAAWDIGLRARATGLVTTPTPPKNQVEAMAELRRTYALKDSELLRVIKPPFSAARGIWADAEYPWASGSKNIRSIGFAWGAGGLRPAYMSYVDQPLEDVVTSSLRIEWYRVEGLEKVKWTPVHGDFVSRPDAPIPEKLTALAGVIKQMTGTSVHFVKQLKSRPCIVLRGKTTAGFKSESGARTVVMSQTPVDAKTMALWAKNRTLPSNVRRQGSVQDAARALAAPFFAEGGEKDSVMGYGKFHENSLFLMAADARLKPDDPELKTKLRKILDFVQEQIGGDWRVEKREIEVYVLEVEAGK
jgi:hypothetical protein